MSSQMHKDILDEVIIVLSRANFSRAISLLTDLYDRLPWNQSKFRPWYRQAKLNMHLKSCITALHSLDEIDNIMEDAKETSDCNFVSLILIHLSHFEINFKVVNVALIPLDEIKDGYSARDGRDELIEKETVFLIRRYMLKNF